MAQTQPEDRNASGDARIFQLAEGTDAAPTPGLPRWEIKFVFPFADLGKLSSILEANCRRVIHRGPVSHVSSIYFDDYALSDCSHSLEGRGDRLKVRLRWYDDPFPSPDCFFEVKRRRHNAMEKYRVPLRCDRPMEDASYRDVVADLRAVLPEPIALTLASRTTPAVLVEYDREHFVDAATGIRLTLDRSIVATEQIGALRPRRRFGTSLGDVIILEAKAPPDKMAGLRNLLYPLQPVVSKYSKYVTSCRTMGWQAGARAAVSL